MYVPLVIGSVYTGARHMATMYGQFAHHLMRGRHFVDQCSPLRHFFARLGLCEHKGEYITMKEYWDRRSTSKYSSYPRLIKTEE